VTPQRAELRQRVRTLLAHVAVLRAASGVGLPDGVRIAIESAVAEAERTRVALDVEEAIDGG